VIEEMNKVEFLVMIIAIVFSYIVGSLWWDVHENKRRDMGNGE
jgi:hypothetical protein